MANLNLFKLDDRLEECFKNAREPNNSYRAIMITMDSVNCMLKLEKDFIKNNNWKSDYEALLKDLKHDTRPFFLLLNTDSDDSKWILIVMVQTKALTKDKMVSASSKVQLKNIFGKMLIKTDLFVEDYDDLSLSKIESSLKKDNRTKACTLKEMEEQQQQDMEIITKMEKCVVGIGGTIHFNCLLDQDALSNLENFKNDQYKVIRFEMSPDCSKIIVNGTLTSDKVPLLDSTLELKKDSTKTLLPNNLEPGYVLFNFQHQNPVINEVEKKLILVCFVPVNMISRKHRFAYSANQNSFIQKLTDKLGENVCRIQVDDLDEVTVERLMMDLYPSLFNNCNKTVLQPYVNQQQIKFDRPSPKNRGPRRLIK